MSSYSTVLGQVFGGGESAAIPELPTAPPLVHYTLESPWPVVVVCILGALVLLWLHISGRLEKKRWARPAMAGLLVVAVAVFMAARLVKTDREVLLERTGEFVGLTAQADMSGLSSILGSEVSLKLLGGEARYSRDQILDLVRRYPGTTPVDWHTIDRAAAVMDGRDVGRTQVHVRARSKEGTLYDVPIGSWWRIDWRRNGGEWKVSGLECMQIDGVPSGTRP